MVKTIDLRLDAGVVLDGASPLQVAASVYLPDDAANARLALVCLAGGNMNRRYYDLQVPDATASPVVPESRRECVLAPAPAPALRDTVSPARDDSFSFATQMTARGFIVITLDHLGLGQSTRPEDGYALTADRIATANANATAEILARLREGRLAPGVTAMPDLRSLGVGHSMGAMLTVLQQAHARQHAGIALLGFSTRGLPKYVPDDVRELAATDVPALRARLVEFARRMFVVAYPRIRSSGGGDNATFYGSAGADPRGVAALKAATDCLLPVPAFLSMVPGNVAAEAAQVDVPVLLMLGEHDMAGPPKEAPRAFSASRAVRLEVLPGAGHSHFLFASRVELFDRLADWAQSVGTA